jgi:Na+-driven multidrug efflux pump
MNAMSAVNTPVEIHATAENFLMIHILSFPFAMMYMFFCAVLRSYGNSSVQLVAIIGCTLLNVVLDPLFIRFMGISGVALATVISEGIMMILVFIYCKKKPDYAYKSEAVPF